MTANDPDEISWLCADLRQVLEEARCHRPAPRPTSGLAVPRPTIAPTGPPTSLSERRPDLTPELAPTPDAEPTPEPEPERSRGMLGWLRRRSV